MRSILGLASLSLFAVGCGALASDDAKHDGASPPPPSIVDGNTTVATAPTCTRERTAPLLAIDGVESSSAEVGPCGDIAFQKKDGSVWLRTAGGDLVQLATGGYVGSFDVTGTYVSFSRRLPAPGQEVIRNLATGVETLPPGFAYFGFNPDTRTPIVYACTNDGVRVLHADGNFGPAIAGTLGLYCGEKAAPFGKRTLAFDTAGRQVSLVDLAAETSIRLEIDYQTHGSFGDGARGDDILISRDGNVVLHEKTTWDECGDTECGTADGYDIISTTTGKITQHAGEGYQRLENAFDFEIARANALVARGGGADSLDTLTGKYVDRANGATLNRIQLDGTLILSRSDQSGTRLAFARPGELTETPWLSTGTAETTAITWPQGKRAVILELANKVQTDDGQSTWGGAEYGSLVVRDESGNEVSRMPYFTSAKALAFPSDGSAILVATHYPGLPPSKTKDISTLGLTSSLVRVAPDGSIALIPGDATGVIELDARTIATLKSEYSGPTKPSTAQVKIYDLAMTHVLKTINGERMGAVPSALSWPAPIGVLALEDRASQDTTNTSTLWHGVADH